MMLEIVVPHGMATSARYGDFRRVHRMGLIACSYRAAEWRHKEIELTAGELLQYLDTKSERRRKR
ncbi:MAG TPA: hypothetical protein VH394_16685 [Thermoanaerobaculia bacterium]|nr:hypothetical protein [Thermoanaerobaculia bacterium]